MKVVNINIFNYKTIIIKFFEFFDANITWEGFKLSHKKNEYAEGWEG
jgi:hypothetical protein